ncbi:hypothetical protein RSSM_03093 [Rhodopirellula sallentina SM41]|uniref:Uncharacterized protein n=1 Tax=Rhodopirellula sallentina SM41 TaxID=1263870 RepID=M5U1Y6_9BACT|nr:hypothetical protein RSSM_03093 [Rhodopirellula sallentina SM41]
MSLVSADVVFSGTGRCLFGNIVQDHQPLVDSTASTAAADFRSPAGVRCGKIFRQQKRADSTI